MAAARLAVGAVARLRRHAVLPRGGVWRLLAAVVLVLSGASCNGLPGQFGAGFSVADAEWVLTTGYDDIAAVYIDEVDMATVTLHGLQGLQRLDPGLEVRRDGDRLELRMNDVAVGGIAPPILDEPANHAHATSQGLQLARQYSPLVTAASREQLLKAVFDGALSGLDRYSRYAGADEARENRANREGFGGIGVTIERFEAKVLIVAVLADTPAAKAGVKANDFLVQVDGAAVDDLEIHDIVRRLRGPVDRPVRVVLQRIGGDVPLSLELRRAHIVPPTVTYEIEDGAAVIRLSGFNQDTANSLADISEDIAGDARDRRVTGVVLDLRANPGGLLDQAVAVADLFLADGHIVSTRGRHPDSLQAFDADNGDVLDGLPVTVLINGTSASAAEIVAAALQDRGRAVLIGTSTFGKGTVQTVMRLPNDSELTLTWARFHAPSGYTIDRLGVLPTICTSGASDDLAELVESLGRGMLKGVTDLARRRAANESSAEAKAFIQSACPWQPEDRPFDVELEVAKRVLRHPALYAGALARQALTTQTDHASALRAAP
jgi:carboxyl-terminal processing protease